MRTGAHPPSVFWGIIFVAVWVTCKAPFCRFKRRNNSIKTHYASRLDAFSWWLFHWKESRIIIPWIGLFCNPQQWIDEPEFIRNWKRGCFAFCPKAIVRTGVRRIAQKMRIDPRRWGPFQCASFYFACILHALYMGFICGSSCRKIILQQLPLILLDEASCFNLVNDFFILGLNVGRYKVWESPDA